MSESKDVGLFEKWWRDTGREMHKELVSHPLLVKDACMTAWIARGEAIINMARSDKLDATHSEICEQWNKDGTCCHDCIDCTAIDEARVAVQSAI
jgi:hypothetical protein